MQQIPDCYNSTHELQINPQMRVMVVYQSLSNTVLIYFDDEDAEMLSDIVDTPTFNQHYRTIL